MLQKTGKSVAEHQRLTTRSLTELRMLEPEVPWIPVLQGHGPEDYLRNAQLGITQTMPGPP
jgi:hypothetical protein